MVALLSQVVCLADDKLIHLFLFKTEQIGSVLPAVKNGYSIRFGSRHIESLSRHPAVDYSCWREELVGGNWFGQPTLTCGVTIEEAIKADAGDGYRDNERRELSIDAESV